MIYDCFTFFNELDLLELRLDTLAGVVDRFVIAESSRTHTNQEKRLYFAENQQRFAKYQDRIIHIIVADNPDGPDSWVRERHQRDSLQRGLKGCSPSDTILISDLDEIPNPQKVSQLGSCSTPYVFEQFNCYYMLNAMNGYWYGTRAVPFELLSHRTLSQIRQGAGTIIPGGGWHFSFIAGVEGILIKLRAFAHQEYNNEQYADPDRIVAALATGADLFSRSQTRAKLLPTTELPQPVVGDHGKYSRFLANEMVQLPNYDNNRPAPAQLSDAMALYAHVKHLTGRVIQMGCADGRATSQLAREVFPELVQAVDLWHESAAPLTNDSTTLAPGRSDDYQTFLRNLFILTRGNFRAHRCTACSYLMRDRSPIKFCQIYTKHDYDSLKAELEQLLPLLVPGGIICGEISPATVQPGQQIGLEQALREFLPGFRSAANFWWWRKEQPTPTLGGFGARLRRRLAPRRLKQQTLDQLRTTTPALYNHLQDWWWRRQARKRMRNWAAQLTLGKDGR